MTHLTVAECAALLRVDHKTVRRLIERGALPALRVGRVLRIDPADLGALAYVPRQREVGRERLSPSGQPIGEFARLARQGYGRGE